MQSYKALIFQRPSKAAFVSVAWACLIVAVVMLRPDWFIAVLGIVFATLSAMALLHLFASSPAMRALQIFIVAFIAAFCVYTYYWVTWNPNGIVDDGWGRPLSVPIWGVENPQRVSLEKNKRGDMATVSSFPGLAFAPVRISYFIRLQRLGSQSASALVFRYTGPQADKEYPPKLQWLDDSHLRISVQHDGRLIVTKMLSFVHGVTIDYDLGEARYELHFWERPFW